MENRDQTFAPVFCCSRARLLRRRRGTRPIPAGFSWVTASADTRPEVHALKITILSTMLADEGIGEWGFGALVEEDGRKILFDTGARPNTVLENAKELKIDLSDVQDVILSHFHDDHTTGLMTLRREFAKRNPAALSRVHVGERHLSGTSGPQHESDDCDED